MRNRFPAALALLFATPAFAATYYIAPPPAGNNANPGTLAQPWATLQRAAPVLDPGDIVYVRAGTYAGGHFTRSGTPAQPILLAAFPGEEPVINANNPVTIDGINLEGASHMIVEGFTVTGTGRAGIRAVLCQNVVIRHNRADLNHRWGIFTGFCDDLLIEHNETSRSTVEHGIYVSNSGDRPVIRNNLIWGNHANGIHMNGDISQGGDGIISDALVENNIIFGNGVGGGSGINCDGVQDSLIRNNLIFDSHASGISLYTIDGGGPSSGNRVLNNTVLTSATGRWALNIRDGAVNNTVRNNILWSYHPSFRGSLSITADSLPGFSSERNAVMNRFSTDGGGSNMTLAAWRTATGHDQHSFVTTPAALFLDVDDDDFHLAADSPALDAGETRGDVPRDLEARGRRGPRTISVPMNSPPWTGCSGTASSPEGRQDLRALHMPCRSGECRSESPG
ncbi:MAG TPA: right-handed parallel beta-helix repeat-containing protein [Xanthomonadaceae bacterium]|nr:right-handed parallel beta-helix repeat-containing protein [Xanthomonadaceae bacterium]